MLRLSIDLLIKIIMKPKDDFKVTEEKSDQENMIFPEGFLWGASTSSHQVEGGNHNDWSNWENSQERINYLKSEGQIEKYGLENFISGSATDHYNLFEQDFKLTKELGHNATRISLEWSRIESSENEFDEKEIEHYKKVISTLRKLGIEPFVTIWHWSIPLWFRDMGSWENRKAPYYFARYVKKIVSSLGPDVKFWLTLNEPEIYTDNSYFNGVWPPQKKSKIAYFRVMRTLIKIHRKAYVIIKKINPEAQVGIAKNNIYYEAYQGKLINRILKAKIDWWWNFYFLNKIKNHQDFIGLNHYFHNRIDGSLGKNENLRTSDMGWELYPEAIYHVLMDLKRYKKPVYITENGLADSADRQRAWFIYESLKNIYKAISEGADVRGYLHWSLMDNFEWDKGFWPRFGLIEIDRKTLKRKVRPSAYFYRDICLANGITRETIDKYKEKIK